MKLKGKNAARPARNDKNDPVLSSMKAVLIENFGGRDQLKMKEVSKPSPGAGEILIRIKAAGVNPVDVKIREGLTKERFPHQFPIIPGWDCSGVVEAAGAGVTRFKEGDNVFTYCRKPVVKDGTYADYTACPAEFAAAMPENLTYEEAASIPLPALTAYQSLIDVSQLRAGETVLVHAGAGGVGGFGIQLAKDRGAQVVATASARNHAYLKELGADEVIDYNTADFTEVCRNADVVFDTVGGATQQKSILSVKPGGRLVTILVPPQQVKDECKRREVRLRYVFVAQSGMQLEGLSLLCETGRLRTRLASVFPLADAAGAHEAIETRHTAGKIVLSTEN